MLPTWKHRGYTTIPLIVPASAKRINTPGVPAPTSSPSATPSGSRRRRRVRNLPPWRRSPATASAPLHDDVRRLGALLGQVVAESGGTDLYDDVERLRRAVRDVRRGSSDVDPQQLVDALDLDQAERVARAFTVLFHLVNLAEERHRVRVLRSRDRRDREPSR